MAEENLESGGSAAFRAADLGPLKNGSFRRLLESRILGQVAQTALLYSLLILVVRETGSSIQTTILVVSFILPSILLGVPAGILADLLPARPLVIAGYLGRAAAVALMLANLGSLWTLYVLVFAISTIGQFTGPAESAALPRIVAREQVGAANALFALSVALGQIAGGVALAPLLLKVSGVEPVLAVAFCVYLAAALLAVLAKSFAGERAQVRKRRPRSLSPQGVVPQGWRLLSDSRPVFNALVHLAVAGTLAKALVVLAPHYSSDVLGIASENTVFVVAPAGIGALLAFIAAPLLIRVLGASRTTLLGLGVLLVTFAGLGLVVFVKDSLLDSVQLGTGIDFIEREIGISSVITTAMLLAIPLGAAGTTVTIAGKAVINNEIAPGRQARAFATQSAFADLASLLPLLLAGAVAELAGVRAVLLLMAIAGSGVTLYSSRRRLARRPGGAD